MPELAEVALYAHDLGKACKGQKVVRVSFPNQQDWGRKIVPISIQRKLRKLPGKTIDFCSEGKALLLLETGKAEPIVEFRLGMTGQFLLRPLEGKWKRHCFLEIQFEEITVRYADPRRFGRLLNYQEKAKAIGGFSSKKGFWRQRDPSPPVGFLNRARISWLLGTGDKTGVGNYMANEALGLLNLSPFEPCKNAREAITILKKCGQIAKKSFSAGGNSFSTGFYNLGGIEGQFAFHCQFYNNVQVGRIVFRGRPVFTKFKIPTGSCLN